MKTCSKCGESKPLDEFWISRKGRTKDGRVSRCKDCAKQTRREWAAKNRDKEGAYNRARYDREATAARSKQWREENPERYAEIRRNKEARRRARKHNAFVEPVEGSVLVARENGLCGICGDPLGSEYHIDHIIPLVKGGMHSYANTQPAHPHCNLEKGAR